MVQTFNIYDLATEIVTTSNKLVNTSNQILNKITDLYTKNITFEENVTVSGDLAVNGAKTSTKILEIANDSQNITPLLKIDDNSSADRNIIELYKQDIEVFSIDNSGKLSTSNIDVFGNLTTTGSTNVKDLTVSGDLNVSGTTVTINTDTYSTEILEIANDFENTAPLLKIDDNTSGSVRNIIQLNKNNDNVFSIDNSGKLNIQGTDPAIKILDTREEGNAILSLKEKNDNFGYDIAYIGKDDNKLYINCYDNNASARTDMTFVRSNGRVGIGTTDPTEKLEVDGNLKANGGKFTSSLVYEKDAPYFYIKDTATSGGTASQAALHVNDEKFYISGPGSAICQTTNLINKYTTFGSNVSVDGKISVAYSPMDGTKTGIGLYGDSTNWGTYVVTGYNDALSMGGNIACKGYGFDHHAVRFRTENNAGYGIIYETINPTTKTEECKFSVRASDGLGYFAGNIHANGSGTPLSFTGNHICKSQTLNLYDNKYIGFIVSSAKKYKSINSKYDPHNIKQNIDKENNDCLPMVELASKPNDKNVFGVISKIESENSTERLQENGSLTSIFKKESYDTSLIISGCGEGFIWVSDYNGQIEAGDLISSSPIHGIGMKQDDDVLRSYTVAKITMDCDFNPAYIPVKVLQSSNYDIEYETTSNIVNTSNYEVEFITSSNTTFTSNLTTEYTTQVKIVNTSNVEKYFKDENGEYIYVNQLDDNGNIIYDYEYEMKYVRLDGTITDENEYTNGSNVYRMALVGGCYKCS